MKVLILGGTRFFGKQAVLAMLKKGYEVTIATRGKAKDDLGNRVGRIILDRRDASSLKEQLNGHYYDVVFDNLCYAPDDVKNLMLAMDGQMGKYIVTSSLAVYDKGIGHKEEAFDPYQYPITYGDRSTFTYGEGKRLVETVCYREYKDIPTIAVRFPVVIGKNDYTRRLFFYVQHVAGQMPFAAPNWDEKMSFISEEEAAEFLTLLVEADFRGPINASSNGDMTVHQIIEIIEEQIGKKAIQEIGQEAVGPYSTYGNVTLDSTKATRLGMNFRDVKDVFKETIAQDLKTL